MHSHMNITRKKFRVGELRPSQVLFTYGIGAIVDLPYISTIVMGLEDWVNPYPQPIGEERLLQAVKSILGPQVSQLLSPPESPEQEGMPNPFDESATIGVPVAAFPRWMLCPRCRTLASLDSGLFQPPAPGTSTPASVHPDRAKGSCGRRFAVRRSASSR